MKRSAEHLNASSHGTFFAMKLLFSPTEVGVITSLDGSGLAEINRISGATMVVSSCEEFYPGTTLHEINVQGESTQSVLDACVHAITKIFQETGAVVGDEPDVEPGGARLKIVVPRKAVASIIGIGGSNIRMIRAQTSLFVHVEKSLIPPIGGDASEQVVSFSGPFLNIKAVFPIVAEHMKSVIGDAWFRTWAEGTNVGLDIPGLVLELSGKGRSGKGSSVTDVNKGAAFHINAQQKLDWPVQQWGEDYREERGAVKDMGAALTMKLLLSGEETSCIIGIGGNTISGLQQATGTKISCSGRNQFYPGTRLQELTIQGMSKDAVVTALLACFEKIVDDIGWITGGEPSVEAGGSRVRLVLPSAAATAVIGKGGANIKELRFQSGLHVHVEKTAIPPGGGDLCEQIVNLSGPLSGINVALPLMVEQVAIRTNESWFGAWASHSNVGAVMPWLTLELSGKGMSKGLGKDHTLALPALTSSTGVPTSRSFGTSAPGPAIGTGMEFNPAPPLAAPPSFSAKHAAYFNQVVMKFLFSKNEGSCIIGQGGGTIMQIQQSTGAKMTLSPRGQYYPGTQLQELNVQGSTLDVVMSAIRQCLTNILEDMGVVSTGEDGVEPGESHVKIVVPVSAATTIIGRGGLTIKELRAQTGLHIHIDANLIPPFGGKLCEQVVVLSGPLDGIHTALPLIAEHLVVLANESWFTAWATNTHCGTVVPGLVLFTDKGKGKGKSIQGSIKPISSVGATTMFGKSGSRLDDWSDGHSGSRHTTLNRLMAMKILVTPKEASCIIGPSGARIGDIQYHTGAKLSLSGRNEYYPGTQQQELKIRGANTDSVLAAARSCLRYITEDLGSVGSGEGGLESASNRLKVVVPARCATSLIGPGGSNIRQLRLVTGLHVHIDATQNLPITEQVVCMSGSYQGLNDALATITEHLGSFSGESWFMAWCSTSNCCSDFRPAHLSNSIDGNSSNCDGEGSYVMEIGSVGGVS